MSPRESEKKAPLEPESFEAALERLEELIHDLEQGDVPLEKSLQAFEDAQRLIAYCEKKLQAAEKALKQLAKEAGEALDHPDEGESPPPR
jgi:exodeoxyribonuclease VII small subunit